MRVSEHRIRQRLSTLTFRHNRIDSRAPRLGEGHSACIRAGDNRPGNDVSKRKDL